MRLLIWIGKHGSALVLKEWLGQFSYFFIKGSQVGIGLQRHIAGDGKSIPVIKHSFVLLFKNAEGQRYIKEKRALARHIPDHCGYFKITLVIMPDDLPYGVLFSKQFPGCLLRDHDRSGLP